jgi:UDP:flavonoid glycosyltransferase YjiC (YdhE family)
MRHAATAATMGRVRVLFTTVALPGHFFPLVPLAWAFRTLGHEVLVATPDNFVGTVARAGLPVVSCGPSLDFVAVADGTVGRSTDVECRYAHGRTFGEFAASSLPETLSLVRTWRPDLVVSERAEFAGPIAARVHDVPAVEFQWSVPALDEYRAAATGVLADVLAGLGMFGLPKPAHVVTSWPASLRRRHAAGHLGMRHVPYNGDSRVPSWLWEPRTLPRICLTMGTVLPHLELGDAVVPVLRRLAELDAELVVAVDDEVAAGWPELPAAVRHRGRLPLSLVLPTCTVAIHHGGHSTSLTALDAGASQLVLPAFDDQLDNADAVVRSGAGLSLSADEVSPDSVADRCATLIEDAEYRVDAAAVAAEIASQPLPVETARRLHTLAGVRGRRAA